MPIPRNSRDIKKLLDLAGASDVDLWATDEVHFQLHGVNCRVWIPPDMKDPVLYDHPTQKSIGYFGAVRLMDGKFMSHRAEEFDAETLFLFVRDLRTIKCHAGRRVELILDNASYHHAKLHKKWREQSQNSFALSFLLPYIIDLNPIERVWKRARRLATHNPYFSTLAEITDAVERAIATRHHGKKTLRRPLAII